MTRRYRHRDAMNSLIKVGLIQGGEIVDEMNQILDAESIFNPLVHGWWSEITEQDLEAALPPGKAYIVENGVYVVEDQHFLIEDI